MFCITTVFFKTTKILKKHKSIQLFTPLPYIHSPKPPNIIAKALAICDKIALLLDEYIEEKIFFWYTF